MIGAYDKKNGWWHWFWYKQDKRLSYHNLSRDEKQKAFCEDIELLEAAHIISAKMMLGLYE